MAAYFAAPEKNRWSALRDSRSNHIAPIWVPATSTWTSPILVVTPIHSFISVDPGFWVKAPCFQAAASSKQALAASIKSTKLSLAWSIQPVSQTLWINSQANEATTHSRTVTTAARSDDWKAAMMEQDGAAAHKAVKTREEATELRAAGLAKHRQQLAQQQAHLAAADAAARTAASGPGLGSLEGDADSESSSRWQLGTFDERGNYDCGSIDACLEQKQAACNKPCQVSDAAQADVDALADDGFDGEEDEWAALLADPVWAAKIAGLQSL